MFSKVTPKRISIFVVFLVAAISLSCQKKSDSEKKALSEKKAATGVVLQFSAEVDSNAYLYTDYGEPPQLAIWLEFPDGKFYKTVFVTHRVGANDWVGKVDCPVALPFWESRQFPAKRRPNEVDPIRAVTGATPKGGLFRASITVPPGSRWRCFLEVNASGDFNATFPYWSKDGSPDDVGNGQPSLVYSTEIVARVGAKSQLKLVGFTDQLAPVDSLRSDWSKITTAKNLIKNIWVQVISK